MVDSKDSYILHLNLVLENLSLMKSLNMVDSKDSYILHLNLVLENMFLM